MTVTVQTLCHYVCDACGNQITVKGLTEANARLGPPWRYVQIEGWVGTFHACQAYCEENIRHRHA